MQRSPFVWLGSRRARKHAIGEPGRLLDESASAGLPVPPGAILLDEFYRLLLEADIVQVEGGRLTVPDQMLLHDAFYNGIRFPRLDYPVSLRPLFSTAETVVDVGQPWPSAVDFTQASMLAEAVAAIWQAALAWEQQNQAAASLRRDFVVMREIETDYRGEAICRSGTAADLVEYQDATTHHTLQLPQLGFWRRPDARTPLFGQRLQKLLRGIRRTIGRGEWRIRWVDDGRVCWLTEIVRLT